MFLLHGDSPTNDEDGNDYSQDDDGGLSLVSPYPRSTRFVLLWLPSPSALLLSIIVFPSLFSEIADSPFSSSHSNLPFLLPFFLNFFFLFFCVYPPTTSASPIFLHSAYTPHFSHVFRFPTLSFFLPLLCFLPTSLFPLGLPLCVSDIHVLRSTSSHISFTLLSTYCSLLPFFRHLCFHYRPFSFLFSPPLYLPLDSFTFPLCPSSSSIFCPFILPPAFFPRSHLLLCLFLIPSCLFLVPSLRSSPFISSPPFVSLLPL